MPSNAAFLAAAGLAVAVIGAECVLRVARFSDPRFHQRDALLGKALRPGFRGTQSREGYARVKINSAGFRDIERPLTKPEGLYRIAVLGDSYVEAMHVPLDATFGQRLERMLNSQPPIGGPAAYEVLNFGVSGYGTAQELILFRIRVAAYKPDLVILAFYPGNDIVDNHPKLARDPKRPYLVPGAGGLEYLPPAKVKAKAVSHFLADYFRLAQFRRHAKAVTRKAREIEHVHTLFSATVNGPVPAAAEGVMASIGSEAFAYLPEGLPHCSEAWGLTHQILEQLQREVHDAGSGLLVCTLSTPVQVHPSRELRDACAMAMGVDDLFAGERLMEEFCGERAIPHVALGSQFRAYVDATGQAVHGFDRERVGFGHWNHYGHERAAAALYQYLAQTIPVTAPPGHPHTVNQE